MTTESAIPGFEDPEFSFDRPYIYLADVVTVNGGTWV